MRFAFLRFGLPVGVLLLAVLGQSVSAQSVYSWTPTRPDTLIFETVGDFPMDMDDIAFDHEGVLWAANGRAVWELSASVWAKVSEEDLDRVLPFAPDSLIGAGRGLIKRSVDNGPTWANVYHDDGALFVTSLGGPNGGILIAGTDYDDDPVTTGFAYSTDRGATWTDATVITSTTRHPEAFAFAEIPDGPNQGRLIGGAMNGIFLSDDGGQTWTESSLVENMRYIVDSVVLGADGRVWASVQDGAVPGGQVYASGDDGTTWTHAATFPYPVLLAAVPGPPEGDGALYAQQTAVPQTGELMDLYRSYSGETWTPVGRVPGPTTVRVVRDVEIGPDGRFYITLTRAGSASEWVYRTTAPVVVSNAPTGPLPSPEGHVNVYPNPSGAVLHIEAPGFSSQGGDPSGAEVTITDVLGRMVYRTRTADGQATVDVSSLAPGVYVVRVGDQAEVVTVRR